MKLSPVKYWGGTPHIHSQLSSTALSPSPTLCLSGICFAHRTRQQSLNHTAHLSVRLGAHWQLKSCGDKKVDVNVRALATKKLLVRATFFQYRVDFKETACVCALLLRMWKGRRKKRHCVHRVVSKRLLNGQFYKL